MGGTNHTASDLFGGRELDDDGSKCVFCGFSNDHALEKHHVVPKRIGGRDNPANIITVCGNCHNTLEAVYNDWFWAKVAEFDIQKGKLGVDIQKQSGLDGFIDERDNGQVKKQSSQDRQSMKEMKWDRIRRKTRFGILKNVYEHDHISATQEDLAECAGLSQQRISQIVNGHWFSDDVKDIDYHLLENGDVSIEDVEREEIEREERYELLNTIYDHEDVDATPFALSECAEISRQRASEILGE